MKKKNILQPLSRPNERNIVTAATVHKQAYKVIENSLLPTEKEKEKSC